ncbi:50S ribosomal protein L18 [Candidatus Pacearchaeota archaeon]|jgi:large subunit ribosomal protein L18|nr:50S ribosomal protein L18 [Candidatus Pacearchaeota archaeon]
MRVPKRRRIEGKTDYANRVRLLKGETPRVVFRRTNKYIVAEYVTSHEAQDKIEIGFNSKKLKEFGWPAEFEGSLKSVPASYLTGFLMGKEIAKKKLSTPIVDVGMIRTISKNKTFAFIKGLIDAGMKIKCAKEKFPEEERIEGKNLKKDFTKIFKEIKSKIDKK